MFLDPFQSLYLQKTAFTAVTTSFVQQKGAEIFCKIRIGANIFERLLTHLA